MLKIDHWSTNTSSILIGANGTSLFDNLCMFATANNYSVYWKIVTPLDLRFNIVIRIRIFLKYHLMKEITQFVLITLFELITNCVNLSAALYIQQIPNQFKNKNLKRELFSPPITSSPSTLWDFFKTKWIVWSDRQCLC